METKEPEGKKDCRDCRHNTGYSARCKGCVKDTRINVVEDTIARIDLFEPLEYDDKVALDIECPFCKENGFDLPGLKHHLLGYRLIGNKPCCQKFHDTEEL